MDSVRVTSIESVNTFSQVLEINWNKMSHEMLPQLQLTLVAQLDWKKSFGNYAEMNDN